MAENVARMSGGREAVEPVEATERDRLFGLAYRLLGEVGAAEDAVQETFLRWSAADRAAVERPAAWLTTVCTNLCLDVLRSARVKRETYVGSWLPEPLATQADTGEAVALAESVGLALLVVMESLTPLERVAFVLHDVFGHSHDQVAAVLGRSPVAVRQLASRARRRVQGAAGEGADEDDVARRRTVVDAFLAASRGGDFAALLALLDPGVVVRADAAAQQMGSESLISGARTVAEAYNGRARAARLALVDGVPALVWSLRGVAQVVFSFTITDDDRVAAIDLLADRAVLDAMTIEYVRSAKRESDLGE
jgi:RNA polymerase sigma factor (sigma-70 family)